jgi:hypothetical protein
MYDEELSRGFDVSQDVRRPHAPVVRTRTRLVIFEGSLARAFVAWYPCRMWKRKKKKIRNPYDPELVEEMEIWNAHWTAPEYGDFYRWDDDRRMFVQAWKPPKAVESKIESDLASTPGNVLALKDIREVGTFSVGGIAKGPFKYAVGIVEADREINQRVKDLEQRSDELLKGSRKLAPKARVIPSGQSNHRSMDTLVLNARKGIDTRPLDELKAWYGWEREFNVQLGTNEYIHVHGIRMSVQSVQHKINTRFGSMYLRVDGKFGMITANLLWSLERNLHM